MKSEPVNASKNVFSEFEKKLKDQFKLEQYRRDQQAEKKLAEKMAEKIIQITDQKQKIDELEDKVAKLETLNKD